MTQNDWKTFLYNDQTAGLFLGKFPLYRVKEEFESVRGSESSCALKTQEDPVFISSYLCCSSSGIQPQMSEYSQKKWEHLWNVFHVPSKCKEHGIFSLAT